MAETKKQVNASGLPCGGECGEIRELREKLAETEEKLAESEEKLQILMESMPGGVLAYEADTGKFVFVGEGCLKLFQCTEEEFRERYYNNFELMVFKQDRERVKKAVEEQLRFFDTVALNYRVEGALGELVWIAHKGRLVTQRGKGRLFYAVLNDVTEEKLVQQQIQEKNEELYFERERYKLIEEAVDELTFDYSVKEDLFSISRKDTGGVRRTLPGFHRDSLLKQYVHPDDLKELNKLWETVRKEPFKGTAEFRARIHLKEYIWYRNSFASFANSEGRVVYVAGSLKDIGKEKEEQRRLMRQARLDGMTGLLNKVTTERTVRECLEKSVPGDYHALLMIDTDNFKAVNDTLGHAYGDRVINIAAGAIRETFGREAVIGRIGGDEFLVFLKNMDEMTVRERAGALNCLMDRTFQEGGSSVCVSCSIGIVFCGEGDLEYDAIVRRADEALYLAKKRGKNCYAVSGRDTPA